MFRKMLPNFLSIRKSRKQLIEECACPLCGNIWQFPKRLPCNHTFCKSCLETYITDNKELHSVCPVSGCQKEYEVSKIKDPLKVYTLILTRIAKKEVARAAERKVKDDMEVEKINHRVASRSFSGFQGMH